MSMPPPPFFLAAKMAEHHASEPTIALSKPLLYADNAPKSIHAVGSRSHSAFCFSHQFASSFIPAPF